MITDLILKNAVETVQNPAADGNCGFQAIVFDIRMPKIFMRQRFNYDKNEYHGCPMERMLRILGLAGCEWFISLECSTYGKSICCILFNVQSYLFLPPRASPAHKQDT